jgi:hypothetical protein
MRRFLILLAVAALALPAPAAAKSWITFSAPSGGVTVGERWDATLKFPLHPDAGPLPRRPELVFMHLDTYAERRFYANGTDARGIYRARVVLPKAGTWTVYVYAREIGSVSPNPHANTVLVRAPNGRSPAPVLLAAGSAVLSGAMLGVFARGRARRSSG